MVKLSTKLASGKEPEEGKTYDIQKVEAITTTVQGFQGIRVTMKSTRKGDEGEYATILWSRETAGSTSKLGAFIKAFTEFLGDPEKGSETDNWVGHTIRFISWKPRNREIEVVK